VPDLIGFQVDQVSAIIFIQGLSAQGLGKALGHVAKLAKANKGSGLAKSIEGSLFIHGGNGAPRCIRIVISSSSSL